MLSLSQQLIRHDPNQRTMHTVTAKTVSIAVDKIMFTDKVDYDPDSYMAHHPILIIKNPLVKDGWICVDGNHRLCETIQKKKSYISCKILTKENISSIKAAYNNKRNYYILIIE